MMRKVEKGNRIKRIMKEVLEKKEIPALDAGRLRSIEELARLHREIEGLGLGYLSKSQIKWLYTGGFEAFKEAKPLIYKLLKEMEEVPGVFPVNLRETAEEVQTRIRERAKEGKIDRKWEKAVVTPSEVEKILRFKIDPFFSRKEKTELIIKTLVEVLEEMYEKEKARHRVEEPEIKVALEVAKKWLERFEKGKRLRTR